MKIFQIHTLGPKKDPMMAGYFWVWFSEPIDQPHSEVRFNLTHLLLLHPDILVNTKASQASTCLLKALFFFTVA